LRLHWCVEIFYEPGWVEILHEPAQRKKRVGIQSRGTEWRRMRREGGREGERERERFRRAASRVQKGHASGALPQGGEPHRGEREGGREGEWCS
jgi:hypothetical protein